MSVALKRSGNSGLFVSMKPKPRSARAYLPSFIALLICISVLQHLWYLRIRAESSQDAAVTALDLDEHRAAIPPLAVGTVGEAGSSHAPTGESPPRHDAHADTDEDSAKTDNHGEAVYSDDAFPDEAKPSDGDSPRDPEEDQEEREEVLEEGTVDSVLHGISAALFSPARHSRSHGHGHSSSGRPRPSSPPFFVENTGTPGGIGAPSFDNWTLYQLDKTPLLLNQAMFDEPGCRRGGDLNANGQPHSAVLRYVMGADGLMQPWDPLVDSEVAKNTEVKLLYPSSVASKLPSNDTDFRFATCAIVSNSGSLLEGNFGAEIDKHDAVFRMNNAPTFGFERFVGSKTTFDLLNRPHADEVSHMKLEVDQSSSPEVAAVLFEADNWHLYYHILERQLRHMPYPSTLVLAPTFLDRVNAFWMRLAKRWPRFANSCSDMKRAALHAENSLRCQKMLRDCQNEVCKPSSGFFALAFASQMCNKIDMYGFESYRKAYPSSSKKKKMSYHYFDTEEGTTNVHSFVLLMKVFEFLSHRYPITIHTPHYDPEAERLLQIEEKKEQQKQRKQASELQQLHPGRFPEVAKPPTVEVDPRQAANHDKPAGSGSKHSSSKRGPIPKSHLPRAPKTSLVSSFASLLERVDVATQRAESAAALTRQSARAASHSD